MYNLNDRVTRKTGRNADEGIVKRVTPTHVDVYWFDSRYCSTIRQDRIKLVKVAPQEPKTYPDWESAQEAMDRGETVRVEMEPFQIDPALVQLAIDLQHKERFEQWKAQQSKEDTK